jgi:hypothetical protein
MWPNRRHLRGRIQKFPDWVDNEIYSYSNKHSLRSNTKGYGVKITRLIHKIAIQLHLVAESCIICSSRSRRPVRKLLVTLSYTTVWGRPGFLIFRPLGYATEGGEFWGRARVTRNRDREMGLLNPKVRGVWLSVALRLWNQSPATERQKWYPALKC